MLNMNDLIGKRLLTSDGTARGYGPVQVVEIKLLEVSPSGRWVRVMNEYGRKHWQEADKINVIEELRTLERCPQPEITKNTATNNPG